MLALSKFFIENPIVKWVTVFLVALIFLFSVRQIKRYAFPRVDLNQILIQTTVPGFSAFEVESEVTDKIEEKLKKISGINLFTSSSYQNFSSIFIEIDPNVSEDEAKNIKDKVRNEVSSISDFPSTLKKKPVITEISIDSKPMMVLGVVSTETNVFKAKNEARKHALGLKERLLQTKVISQINESIQAQQVHILLNAKKLEAYNLSVEEVIGKLKNNQVRLSSGTLKKGNEVKRLITYSKAESLEAVKNLVVRSSGFGRKSVVVTLDDVATVRLGLEENTKVVKFNGYFGYQLSLIKKGDSDIIETAEAINQVIRDYEFDGSVENLDNLKIVIHDDDSKETQERLSIAYSNALFGLVLVCFTLFFFLNRSIAFWSCLGIPSTLFLSVVLMWLNEVSINTVSLCGIIIMLGIIVDNPTIIGESVYHYRQLNYNKKKASLMTLERVLKPLIFAGLTTVVSFGSMFFIPGTLGQFASEIPLVVTFMLVASFFESTLILPAHLSKANMGASKPWGERFILFLRGMYEKTLDLGLRQPLVSVSIMMLFLGIGVAFAFLFVKFQLFPVEQAFKIDFTGETEINSSLKLTEQQVDIVEEILESYPKENVIASYRTTVGGTAENEFAIQLRLISYFDREVSAEQFKDYVVAEVNKKRKNSSKNGLQLESFNYFIDGGGVPGGRPIEINVFGRELKDRKLAIEKIKSDLKEASYFSEITSSVKEGKLEHRVVPSGNVGFANIDMNKISTVLRSAYAGIGVGKSEISGQSLEWWLKYDPSSIDFNDPLKNMYVLNPNYQRVKVEDLVKVVPVSTVTEIQHEGGARKNIVSANFDKSRISAAEVYNFLTKKYNNFKESYPKVRLVFGGEAKKSADTLIDFVVAILGSVILIYFLLVIQFNSFVQPFMVITSIPFGIVGIVIAFGLQNYSLSFLGMIGVLGFGGVVINASLIMVDYINKIKNGSISEENLKEADFNSKPEYLRAVVVRGAALRFRPIVITTFTTVIGLVPTAYGVLGRTDVMIAPMTLAMLWGLIFGTIGGLYAIPIFYLFHQKIMSYTKKN